MDNIIIILYSENETLLHFMIFELQLLFVYDYESNFKCKFEIKTLSTTCWIDPRPSLRSRGVSRGKMQERMRESMMG